MPQILWEESPLSDQLPASIPITLKVHQRASLFACMRMERDPLPVSELGDLQPRDGMGDEDLFEGANGNVRTRLGILGDRVGSGKSYVILSLVYMCKLKNALPCSSLYDARAFAGGNVLVMLESRPITARTSLLVIPHNLTSQWTGYVQQFASELTSKFVCRKKHLDELKAMDTQGLDQLDLLVVTNTFYNSVALHLGGSDVKIARVIFDEADSIHIGNIQVSAGFYWYVTASFTNLLGPMYEARSTIVRNVFQTFTPTPYRRVVQAMVIQNRESFILKSFDYPNIETINMACRSPQSIDVLNGMVDQNIIACLNAGDVPAAILYVNPTHKNTEDNIITVLIDKHTRDIKNTDLRIGLVPTLEYSSESEKMAELNRLVKKKSELELVISRIRERIVMTDSCCICYESIVSKSVVPCCSNSYCFPCLCRWIADRKATCPLCKAPLKTSDIFVVQDEGGEGNKSMRVKPTKLETLESLVRHLLIDSSGPEGEGSSSGGGGSVDRKKRRLLIFSSHDYAFIGITDCLRRLDVKYQFLRGNHVMIRAIVDKYASGSIEILLVNPLHYGSGLNFEMTTDIIMYHQVHRELENQVIGRAMRIGRSNPLKIWNLCYENEILDPHHQRFNTIEDYIETHVAS